MDTFAVAMALAIALAVTRAAAHVSGPAQQSAVPRRRRWPETLRSERAHLPVARLPVLLLLTVVLACGDGETLTPPAPIADRELYWELDLNHHAVLMSSANPLYDTLTLVATPRNRHGEALRGRGTPTFVLPPSEQLVISPEGKLIALAPTSEPVPVIATLTIDNLKYEDTVYVTVVDDPDPPVLASFSAHPLPPDSAKLGMILGFIGPQPVRSVDSLLHVRALDTYNNPIVGLPVSYRSSDPTVLEFEAGSSDNRISIRGNRPGTALIYASTTAFGVAKADTVPFRIGWPISANIVITPNAAQTRVFSPADLTVGTGAVIGWGYNGGVVGDSVSDLDITFADADVPAVLSPVTYEGWWTGRLTFLCVLFDCNTGNILAAPSQFGGIRLAFRILSKPGIYEYHSDRFGITGRITVVDESGS